MSKHLVLASSLLLALVLPLSGCTGIANDAGELPPGDWADFAILDMPEGLQCGSFQDGSVIIQGAADIDEIVATCSEESEAGGLADFLTEELEAIGEDEVLVFVTIALGGCIAGHDLPFVSQDQGVIRPWLIKDDSAYGMADANCTADLGEALELLRVYGAEEAGSAELSVGIWNSTLPGSPYEAHGLGAQ